MLSLLPSKKSALEFEGIDFDSLKWTRHYLQLGDVLCITCNGTIFSFPRLTATTDNR